MDEESIRFKDLPIETQYNYLKKEFIRLKKSSKVKHFIVLERKIEELALDLYEAKEQIKNLTK